MDKVNHRRRPGIASSDSILELQQRVLEICRGRYLSAQHARRRPGRVLLAIPCECHMRNGVLSSEHSATFLRPDDLMSRGEHFHKEALRLWILERGKASLTNIQALIIMSMEAGFRGKDKLGFSLSTIALQMNHDLPFPLPSPENLFISDKLRVRTSASWTTHLFEMLVCPWQRLLYARQVTQLPTVPIPSVFSESAHRSTKGCHYSQISPRSSMCGMANLFSLPIATCGLMH